MMNKVLVEVVLPAAEMKFDVYIPLDIKVYDARLMIAELLSNLSDGKFKATNDTVLCNANTGDIFDINMFVAETEIKNGSQLMLI